MSASRAEARPMSSAPAPVEVDLLLFEVGGQLFAADPTAVVRVDRPNADLPTAELAPSEALRTLVGLSGGAEFQLPVDRVLGVKRFPAKSLRRTPAALTQNGTLAGSVMGLLLDGPSPVPIVDLQTLSARARTTNEET